MPRNKVFGAPELPRDQAVLVGKTGDWVAFQVGEWTIYLAIEKHGRFPEHRPKSSAPPQRLPVLAVRVLLDPSGVRLRRGTAVGTPLPHPAGNPFRRPLLRQSGAHGLVDRGIVHLPHQRTIAPRLLGLTLGLCGIVLVARAVAPPLAADRGRPAPEGAGDFLLIGAGMSRLGYAIALCQGKMTCYRWDCVPEQKLARLHPWERSSDVFSKGSFRGSFPDFRLHLRLGTTQVQTK